MAFWVLPLCLFGVHHVGLETVPTVVTCPLQPVRGVHRPRPTRFLRPGKSGRGSGCPTSRGTETRVGQSDGPQSPEEPVGTRRWVSDTGGRRVEDPGPGLPIHGRPSPTTPRLSSLAPETTRRGEGHHVSRESSQDRREWYLALVDSLYVVPSLNSSYPHSGPPVPLTTPLSRSSTPDGRTPGYRLDPVPPPNRLRQRRLYAVPPLLE